MHLDGSSTSEEDTTRRVDGRFSDEALAFREGYGEPAHRAQMN
jgi:hypothetical protein